MTKSQRSATKKLPLAKLFRALAVLCFIKLAIFLMILLDFPFPSLFPKSSNPVEMTFTQKVTSPSEEQGKGEMVFPVSAGQDQTPQQTMPVAGLTPVRTDAYDTAVSGSTKRLDESFAPILRTPDFPLPDPLPAPIAEPGTIAREESKPAAHELPIPTLGTVTIAQAASQMPVPQISESARTDSLAPAEQQAPLVRNMPLPTPPQRSGGLNAIPDKAVPLGASSQDLVKQQQDMLVLKKQMDDRIKELQDSEAKVKRMLMEARGLETEKLKSLIQMFGNMKPKTAAKALENMDEHTACRILEGLTPKQSGDILSYTNPAVTAKLTELMSHVKMK